MFNSQQYNTFEVYGDSQGKYGKRVAASAVMDQVKMTNIRRFLLPIFDDLQFFSQPHN